MVADEIAGSDDLAYNEAVDRITAQPASTNIEFFGGEPTIYPRFLDLLRVTRRRGHPCSIASNARVFHSERYTASVAALGADAIYVRTSLYGDTPELHDHYTATPRSFEQTTRAIQNLVNAGFRVQVNLVILKQNVQRLSDITRLIYGLGVPRIKFGNLIDVAASAAHAVSLSIVRPQLADAVALAESLGLVVTIEKTPICVASGRIDLMSTERLLYGGERAYDDTGKCATCLVRRWCDGVDPGYAALYGMDALQAIVHVPRRGIRELDPTPEPALLKTCCVAIDDDRPEGPTLLALEALQLRVAARHGRLAVFPRRYLREAAEVAP
jgi:pyruvate-formate lyase-activating enzyme